MATTYFRLNMTIGYGPSSPAPASPPGGGSWTDVSIWQTFLHNHNCTSTWPANNMFGQPEKQGTIAFQIANGIAPPNGVVNAATYAASGLPYPNP
jgi:hypothetical protein